MESFIRKIYLYYFIDSFILIAALFSLYFTQHGLNPFQVSVIITIWSLVTIIGEVPAGVLADKYSRKNILIAASFCRAFGFLLWFLFPNFLGFSIGIIFWGLRNILSSGTFEALVYDELKFYEKEHEYEKITGRVSGFMYLGLMFSSIIGGFIAQWNFNIVLIISIATSLLASLPLLLLKSVKPTAHEEKINSFSIFKEAIIHIKQEKILLNLILFICFIFATYAAVDDFWPLIFNNLIFSISEIGALIAIIYGIAAIAGYTTHLIKFQNNKNNTYIFILLAGSFYVLVGSFKLSYLIPLLFISVYFLKMTSIKFEAKLQNSIISNQRATISSIKSFIFEIVYMLLILTFGIVGTHINLLFILIIAGSFIIFISFIFKIMTKIFEIN